MEEIMQEKNGRSGELVYKVIGIIHSPFKRNVGIPIQPTASQAEGWVEVYKEYEDGLEGIEEFSHIILIYHFHLIKKAKLKVVPYMDTKPKGVFATRAPSRPNPIGISTVKLLKREGNILHIKNVDIVDSTPLLDIKPYVPQFGDDIRIGWLEDRINRLKKTKDDGRFS